MQEYNSNIYNNLWSEDWQNLQALGPLTHNRYRLMLRELPDDLPKTMHIMDAGCGRGSFLELLRKKNPEAILHGIEYSQEAFQAANPDIKQNIKVGNIEELVPNLASNSYDLIVCSEVLEHLQNPQASLNSLVSLLKPGGLALLTVPGCMRYWSKEDIYAGHYRRFELAEFANLVKNSGLKVEHSYGWGVFFGLIYYRLVLLAGSERVNSTAVSPLSKFISNILQKLFLFDDLFPSKYGLQIITRARKPLA